MDPNYNPQDIEVKWQKRWADDKQYEEVLAARENAKAEPYVLHDGPPYPTGGIHYGTLLNKVLKDIIVRSRLLMGKSARFVPGGNRLLMLDVNFGGGNHRREVDQELAAFGRALASALQEA